MELLNQRKNHLKHLAEQEDKLRELRNQKDNCHAIKIALIQSEIKLCQRKISTILADLEYNQAVLEKTQLVHQLKG